MNKPKTITSTVNYIIGDDDITYQLDGSFIAGLKEPLNLKDILFAKSKFPDTNASFEVKMDTYIKVWKALEVFRDNLTITKVVDGENVTYEVK